MKFLQRCKDGGKESTVWAYFLTEIKSLFSIALLKFENGSREAYHDHAFNCISWVLSGHLEEHILDGGINHYKPSLIPIITKMDTFHKVYSHGNTWVLTFRGPWVNMWHEFVNGKKITLTHGRKKCSEEF